MNERFYRPRAITYDNLDEAIAEGAGLMDDNGAVVVDLGGLETYNTLLVCLLLALLRVGAVRKCCLRVANADERVDKLLELYQLRAWFA